MTAYDVRMEAPTVAELAIHPLVEEALEQAWKDSFPDADEQSAELLGERAPVRDWRLSAGAEPTRALDG
jgi:hypothetical protein